jgi:hypothetical protein
VDDSGGKQWVEVLDIQLEVVRKEAVLEAVANRSDMAEAIAMAEKEALHEKSTR